MTSTAGQARIGADGALITEAELRRILLEATSWRAALRSAGLRGAGATAALRQRADAWGIDHSHLGTRDEAHLRSVVEGSSTWAEAIVGLGYAGHSGSARAANPSAGRRRRRQHGAPGRTVDGPGRERVHRGGPRSGAPAQGRPPPGRCGLRAARLQRLVALGAGRPRPGRGHADGRPAAGAGQDGHLAAGRRVTGVDHPVGAGAVHPRADRRPRGRRRRSADLRHPRRRRRGTEGTAAAALRAVPALTLQRRLRAWSCRTCRADRI